MTERKALVFAVDATEYIPAQIIENTARPYSCTLIGKSVQVGIPLEKQTVCPDFINTVGVSANSSEWTERVSDFWSEWEMDIPISKMVNGQAPNGIIIDGSFEEKDGKLYPVNLQDYIAFNLLMNDASVGKSEQDYLESIDQFDYFIIDLSEKEKAESIKAGNSKNVLIALGKLFAKENHIEVIKQILLTSKKYDYYDIVQMTNAQLELEIPKYAEKETTIFLALLDSTDLENRALVNEMASLDVLTIVDGVYFNGTQKIGKMPQMLAFLTSVDEETKSSVEKLKITLEEKKLRNVVTN